jgi:hypothetical protein
MAEEVKLIVAYLWVAVVAASIFNRLYCILGKSAASCHTSEDSYEGWRFGWLQANELISEPLPTDAWCYH